MNKKFALLLLCIVSSAVIILINNSKDTKPITSMKDDKKDERVILSKAETKSVAKPVSVKNLIQKETPKRVIASTRIFNKKPKIINTVSQSWKQKYQDSFLKLAKNQSITDFKIQHKKSLLKVDGHNIGKNLEQIIVSYNLSDGRPYSFEALINSETGQVEQSWNHTQYEFKKPLKLNLDGRGYRQ